MAAKGRGWHGESGRHSQAARGIKSVPMEPVQVIDRDVLRVMEEIMFLKEKRRKSLMAPEDVESLSILNEQIRLKEEFIEKTLPKKQMELMALEAV